MNFQLGTAGTTVFFDLTPAPLVQTEDALAHGTAVIKRVVASFNLAQEATVDNVNQVMAVGLYVANRQAVVDDLAVSDPLGGLEQDWHYWSARAISRENVAEGGGLNWDIDIRSSRRLRGDQRYIMVVQPLVANTSNLDFFAGIRLLWSISN